MEEKKYLFTVSSIWVWLKYKLWPLGIIIRGLTSNNDEEIKHCIEMLKSSNAGIGFMHESFNKNDAGDFTRKWFAWANTLFGEFL